MDELEDLRELIAGLDAGLVRDAGMEPIRSRLPDGRIGFFPVGNGFLGPAFPRHGTLLVGSEFGTSQNVKDVVDAGGERLSDPTWRKALRQLDAAGVDRNTCWFTNFAVDARAGTGSNSSEESPWIRHASYADVCGRLFVEQIARARPRALVLYGGPVARAMAMLRPETFGHWTLPRFRDRDERDGALRCNVRFGAVEVPVVISLVHPSKGHLNERHRLFDGFTGAAAESALLRVVAEAVAAV